MLRKLREQLRKEFHWISPDLIKAVAELASGGANGLNFEQFCAKKISGMQFDTTEEKINYIYRNMLLTGRKLCKNNALLEVLKMAILESATEVKLERAEKKQASLPRSSVAVLTTESSSPAMFNAVSKKRKITHESKKEDLTHSDLSLGRKSSRKNS